MTRRQFLTTVAAATPMAARAQSGARSAMGVAATALALRGVKDTLQHIEYCHSLGAGGVQAGLTSLEPADVRRVRERLEQLGMFYEGAAGLPRDDGARFERAMAAAKDAGAICMRVVCLGGRRYETFNTLEDWKKFVADSHAALGRAARIADKVRLPLALENHKDWTLEEMLPIIQQYGGDYFGVCLDTGNNMALLDDPMEFVRQLAPYAISTHIKDMGVEESPDGFLLSEVVFGDGLLDIPGMVRTIAAARPKTKFTLEMITRNPLSIPCLTEKYWATFTERNGKYLARMLALVRRSKSPAPLPRTSGLERDAQARLEEDNVRKCLVWARDRLGLVL